MSIINFLSFDAFDDMNTSWISYCIKSFLQFYSIMMTDQLEQEITHFKKKIDNLNIEIQLLTEEDAIWVKVMNLDSLECFEQVIDTSYIQNHKDLNYIFEAPRELMKYFTHHYKELNISSDGIIKFTIKFSETVKPKIVVINLKAKTMDKVEMLNLKMEKVKQDFAQTLAEKDRTIEQLKNRIQALNQSCEQSSKMLKNCFFYTHAHPDAYQNQYFLTKYTGKSIIVNHIGDNTNFIFVFNHEITVGVVKKYALKVLKSASIANVFFCFGSRLILSNSAFNSAEIASYQCNGNLYEGGAQRNIGVSTNVGDDIECQLSLIDNMINWIKGGNQFATTTLPQQMRNKSLYFALIVHCKYDEVEVMLN